MYIINLFYLLLTSIPIFYSTLSYTHRLLPVLVEFRESSTQILIHTYGLSESGKMFAPRRIPRWDSLIEKERKKQERYVKRYELQ